MDQHYVMKSDFVAGGGCLHMAFLRLPMCHGRLDLCPTALLLPTDQGSGLALPILRFGALPAVAVEAVKRNYQLDSFS